MSTPIISASILAADFANLGEEAKQVLAAGADHIHFDVMDHHYVPNLSFGSMVCQSLRKAGINAPIDVHLMVDAPEKYIRPFSDAGADMITFHPSTTINLEATLQQIRDLKMKTGLAFNPSEPVDIPSDLLPLVDMVLLMSVNPGFAGQSFIETCLDKITDTRKWLEQTDHEMFLGIDGGINVSNIGKVVSAGATFVVLGSALFGAENYQKRMDAIRREIKS